LRQPHINEKRAKPFVLPSPIAKISKLQLPMKKTFFSNRQDKVKVSFQKFLIKFSKILTLSNKACDWLFY
jgi:hypothetical protein